MLFKIFPIGFENVFEPKKASARHIRIPSAIIANVQYFTIVILDNRYPLSIPATRDHDELGIL